LAELDATRSTGSKLLVASGAPGAVKTKTHFPFAISGKRDGDYSVHRAQLRNQPKGTAIYSAVDYDAQPSDMTQIKAFFTAFAKSIRGAGYKVGCYGSGYTCNQLLAAKLIDYTWITCSSGFRDSKTVIQQGTYDIWQVFGLCDAVNRLGCR
jgi:hypothetical protein